MILDLNSRNLNKIHRNASFTQPGALIIDSNRSGTCFSLCLTSSTYFSITNKCLFLEVDFLCVPLHFGYSQGCTSTRLSQPGHLQASWMRFRCTRTSFQQVWPRQPENYWFPLKRESKSSKTSGYRSSPFAGMYCCARESEMQWREWARGIHRQESSKRLYVTFRKSCYTHLMVSHFCCASGGVDNQAMSP